MINKITELTKEYLMFSKSEINVKKNRNDFEIVDRKNTHNIKVKKNKVIIIMSINVTETYDYVLQIRFFHNLNIKKFQIQ